MRDENLYDFKLRSDGFKRFVSFLLVISARVRSHNFKNSLILIDDPDNGLHPSGAKYLKDELFKIAENNLVVYTTHSIFMIEKNDISRHYILKKENEITTIHTANGENYLDEEVLFRALGTSVFESISEKNIVFEGWYDKQLFNVWHNSSKGKKSSDSNRLKNIGMCHVQGVKDVQNLTSILELGNRSFLVVTDDDEVAKEHQKKYNSWNKYKFGIWCRYPEIWKSCQAITGEDFIKDSYLMNVFNDVLDQNSIPNPKSDEIGQVKGILQGLRNYLDGCGVEKYLCINIIKKLKEEIFENLKSRHIKEDYGNLYDNIIKKINNIQLVE